MGAMHFQNLLEAVAGGGTPFAIDATAAAIRNAILDPASYASGGWRLPGLAGARLSASARASVAMQQRRDDLLGSELVVNGGFAGVANGTNSWALPGWVVYGTPVSATVQNESLVIVTDAPNEGARIDVASVLGRSYRISYTQSGTSNLFVGNIVGLVSTNVTTPTYSVDVVATGSTISVYFRAFDAAAGTATIDNVSVREVIVPALGWEFAPHNLLTASDTTNALVTKVNITTTAGASLAPDGTMSMQRLLRTSAAANCFTQFAMSPVAVGQFGTVSAYIRQGSVSGSRVGLRIQGTYPARMDVVFNPATGTVVGGPIGTTYTDGAVAVQDVGGGIYRVTLSCRVAGNAATNCFVGPTDASLPPEGWEGVSAVLADAHVWGMQFNLGPAATAHVPTAGSAVYGPAIDWLSGIGAYGLRSEEARTNSIRNSACVGGGVGAFPTNWSGVSALGVTVSATGAGTENGFPYLDVRFNGTASGVGFPTLLLEATTQIAAASGQAWTGTAFYRVVSGTMPAGVTFTVSERAAGGGYLDGTTATLTTSAVTQRVAVSRTFANGTTASVLPSIELQTANATAYDFTLRIACPQLEQGAFATSPILTFGASATRAADAAVVPDSGWISQTEGTLIADGRTVTVLDFPTLAALCRSDNSYNAVQVLFNAPSSQAFLEVGAGTQQVNAGVSVASLSAINKVAGGYKVNDFAVSANGGSPAVDASGSIPTGLTQLRLGNPYGLNYPLNGHLTRIRYATRRFTNAELQAVSA